MICPQCGFDNIAGIDDCEACSQPLVAFDPSGGELEQSINRHTVGSLVVKNPVTLAPDQTVREAIDAMTTNHIGAVLVAENDELVGIFTERDVLNKTSSNPDRLDQPIASHMTAAPATINGEDSIAYALHAMDVGGYRHLPVMDPEDHPSGVISVRDILRFLGVRFAALREPTD